MNFKDEYKKSADSISPDREAIDRMKAAVMAKLAEEQGEFPDVPLNSADSTGHQEKSAPGKPIPFKRIAVIGGAVAACAVVTVAAFNLLPDLKSVNTMVNEASSCDSSAAMEESGFGNAEDSFSFIITNTTDSDADDVCEDAADGGSSDFADNKSNTISIDETVSTTVPVISSTAQTESDKGDGVPPEQPYPVEAAEPGTYEEYTDESGGFPAAGVPEPILPSDNAQDASTSDARPAEAEDSSDKSFTDSNDIEPDAGFVTSEAEDPVVIITGEADTVTMESTVEPVRAEETMEMEDCTEEILCATEDSEYYETDEAPLPPEPPKLVLSKGWLTYDGKRYDLDSSVTTAMFPYSPITAENVLDGREYYIYLDGYVLKLFDGDKNFIGLYRRRA